MSKVLSLAEAGTVVNFLHSQNAYNLLAQRAYRRIEWHYFNPEEAEDIEFYSDVLASLCYSIISNEEYDYGNILPDGWPDFYQGFL